MQPKDLSKAFFRRSLPTPDPEGEHRPDEPITFAAPPSWATSTGVYEIVGPAGLNPGRQKVFRAVPSKDAVTLPSRRHTWPTRQGDEVGEGDVVALSGIVGNPDAIGLIVGPGATRGRVKCVVGGNFESPSRQETEVDAENLVKLLREAPKPTDTEGLQGPHN